MNRARLLLLMTWLLWLATVPLALGLFAAGLLLKLEQERAGAPDAHIRHGMALAAWDSSFLDLLLIAGFAVLAGLLYATVAYFVPAYAIIRFSPAGIFIDAIMVGAGIIAQIYRYRYVATPVQRQQCKWVLCGFGVAFVGFYTSELPLVLGANL